MAGDEPMDGELTLSRITVGAGTETIHLQQVMLGFYPYALIQVEPASDGSGEPAITLTTGGGAEEEPLYLPVGIMSEYPPEGNPVADMLRTLASNPALDRDTLKAVTEQFNNEWLPYVMGGE